MNKSKLRKMEVRSKMLSTVNAIAGNSKMGMTVAEAMSLTEKTLDKRRSKRKAQRAARKKNRGKG